MAVLVITLDCNITVLKLHQKSHIILEKQIYTSKILYTVNYIEQLLLTPKVNEKLIRTGRGKNQ